ncbi:MAG: hypothetical protein LUE11_07095 [Clostridia bacterium]|nr:hypothetical protein [Clostridia bacterium]
MKLAKLNTERYARFNFGEDNAYRVCNFAYDSTNNLLYKFYPHNDNDHYQREFEFEFDVMREINNEWPNSPLFPQYHSWGIFEDCGYPFIAMEFIEGDTLEYHLRQASVPGIPAFLFSPEQVCHIVDQIHAAQTILCQHSLMYFDLSPSNVILRNENFDICLIDFTFCCRINHMNPYQCNNFKKIDARLPDVTPDFPMQLVLRQSLYLFFSRLFYCGSGQYAVSFDPGQFNSFRLRNNMGSFPDTPYNEVFDSCRTLFQDEPYWYNNYEALLAPLNVLHQQIMHICEN